MANVKFIAVSRGLRGIVDYVTNREKTVERLISGVNCVARTAVPEFEAVKKQFRKTEGRGYYHIVQAFAPDDPLDFTTAHELGIKLAEHFEGYQCIVVTHMNTAHIHNHIIMNSVNFETGMKFHQSAREMQQVKDYCSQLCREYGLSVTESKADPFRIPTWKRRLTDHIKEAMEQSRTQQEFVAYMNAYGYDVKWEPHQKYITYTTPENIRCRDSKLFDQTLKRENNALKDRDDPFKDFYKSLPICILDAVFSIGVRYTSVVNVVNSYIGTFDLTISRTQADATEHTIRDFLANVAKYDTIEDFSKNVLHNMQRTSSRSGILKAEACREIALVCQKHGINTLRDFNDYTDKAALDKDIKSVRGQSSGIMLKYLYMLAGDENRVKPDRHIVRFIKETCALQKLTDDDVQAIMVRAVEMLKPEYPNITVRFLDSLIWEAQRQ